MNKASLFSNAFKMKLADYDSYIVNNNAYSHKLELFHLRITHS